MGTEPLRQWDDDDIGTTLGDEALQLPPTPRLRRCGAINDVGEGPWIGTLACCSRPVGHEGRHAMSLGDPGSPSYWEESWA
jgi:hypothetical protein